MGTTVKRGETNYEERYNYTTYQLHHDLRDFGFGSSGNTLGTKPALNMHREKTVKPTSIKEEKSPS